MRYFVNIAYNGYHYRGWQRQPKVATLQQVIEDSFLKVFGKRIPCIGCGRTDAMVHASQFFFHFDQRNEWDFDLKFRLNKILPDDISIIDIIEVEGKPHAQFDAIERTYNYFIHTQKNPFIREVSSLYQHSFNLDAMSLALKHITKYTDFFNFCIGPNRHSSTICKVSEAMLFTIDNGNYIRVKITANRFLHGMVRSIVQKLIEVGTEVISPSDFEDYLGLRKKSNSKMLAYPQGLHLTKVSYTFLDNPTKKWLIGEPLSTWQSV